MKYVILLLLPIILNGQDIEYIKMLERAAFNANSCDSLLHYNINHTNNMQEGYIGAALMMKAKHTKSIYNKWKYFQQGKKKLEHAIRNHPKSKELRLIRYYIQKNTPSFLNYNKHIEEDTIFLNINKTDKKKDSIITIKIKEHTQ